MPCAINCPQSTCAYIADGASHHSIPSLLHFLQDEAGMGWDETLIPSMEEKERRRIISSDYIIE